MMHAWTYTALLSAPSCRFSCKKPWSLTKSVTPPTLCCTGMPWRLIILISACITFVMPPLPPHRPLQIGHVMTFGKEENRLKSDLFITWVYPSVNRSYSKLASLIKSVSLGKRLVLPSASCFRGWGDIDLVLRKVTTEKNQLFPLGPSLQFKLKFLIRICPVSSCNLLQNLFSFTIPSFFQLQLLSPCLACSLSNSLRLCLELLVLIF